MQFPAQTGLNSQKKLKLEFCTRSAILSNMIDGRIASKQIIDSDMNAYGYHLKFHL